MKSKYSHAASIFPVDDPLATAVYYRDVLGFEIRFQWGDPPDYVVVNRDDEVSIHFSKKQDDFAPSTAHISLMIFVNDIDALYEEYQKTGANITNPIGDREWGMRDFDITDPNGFIISFGTEIPK
ncbi:VOC family protein [Marinoscillum pacificum]|uniref:VOC family protein n=1 Tax=Marinoscillum pacificum TaxID=392723 RepID=UPI002157063B|nr:VOC family protein [Marinoscillum pacificum]